MRIINYNWEDDELLDVLLDNQIEGLSHATEDCGTVSLYVNDDWNDDSMQLVKKICKDFGCNCQVE